MKKICLFAIAIMALLTACEKEETQEPNCYTIKAASVEMYRFQGNYINAGIACKNGSTQPIYSQGERLPKLELEIRTADTPTQDNWGGFQAYLVCEYADIDNVLFGTSQSGFHGLTASAGHSLHIYRMDYNECRGNKPIMLPAHCKRAWVYFYNDALSWHYQFNGTAVGHKSGRIYNPSNN